MVYHFNSLYTSEIRRKLVKNISKSVLKVADMKFEYKDYKEQNDSSSCGLYLLKYAFIYFNFYQNVTVDFVRHKILEVFNFLK